LDRASALLSNHIICLLVSLALAQNFDESQASVKKKFLKVVVMIINTFIFHIQTACVMLNSIRDNTCTSYRLITLFLIVLCSLLYLIGTLEVSYFNTVG
jgi:hypothetical protein